MRIHAYVLQSVVLLAVLFLLPAAVRAQPYTYTNNYGTWYYATNNGTITINSYDGQNSGISAVTVPSTINGLPVTTIAGGAFGYLYANDVTSVIIPNSVTSIQGSAFYDCYVTNVLVGNGVTNIGQQAFEFCSGLKGIYFLGDAPSYGVAVFQSDNNATVYYLASGSGWTTNFANRPTALWNPLLPPLGIATYGNQPALFFSTPANFPASIGTNYVVQMTTNLASSNWVTITNAVPVNCLLITNAPSNAFFRMQP
jgi:hypothetical protein